MLHLAPGDPLKLKTQGASGELGNTQAAEAVLEHTRKLYGLDKPLHQQYFAWLGNVVHLRFGTSYSDEQPVLGKILAAAPVTLTLNFVSFALVWMIAIPLGLLGAQRAESRWYRAVQFCLFVFYAVPSFWLALMLMEWFAGGVWNWFPVLGLFSEGIEQLSWWGQVSNVLWHLVLPVLVLSLGSFAFLTRFVQSNTASLLREPFVRTACAYGVSEQRLLTRHVFQHVLVLLVSLMSSLLPALLSGSVLVEQIFALPGMGRLAFEAVLMRDYPLIMALTVINTVLTFVSMLLADVLQAGLDPRMQAEKEVSP